MATNRRRILRGNASVTLDSFGVVARLCLLVGLHPDDGRSPWRSWPEVFEVYEAVRGELLARYPTTASGEPPWAEGAYQRWQADPEAVEFTESYRAKQKREAAELAAFAYKAIDASLRAGTWIGPTPAGHGGTPRGVDAPGAALDGHGDGLDEAING
jgi:hypothetical protein